MKYLKGMGKIIRSLFILEVIFTIHEYGHLIEMQKQNIPIQEFSLGTGPSIYQYPIGNIIFNVRIIPIMAYVQPTDKGFEELEKLPFIEKTLVYVAGVRNNILSGLGAVLLLQCGGWRRKKLSFSKVIQNALQTIISALVLFPCFVIETFTFRAFKLELSNRFAFPIPVRPPKLIEQFIYWNFLIGYFNLLPIFPLDGGELFIEVIRTVCNDTTTTIVLFVSILMCILFIFVCGVSDMEFVDYE